MITVLFDMADGERRAVVGHAGDSVMRIAVQAGIEGIEAICGGSLSCATCHVRVDSRWHPTLPPPSDDELALLDFTEAPRTTTSRLSCQVRLTEAMNGLVVSVPKPE